MFGPEWLNSAWETNAPGISLNSLSPAVYNLISRYFLSFRTFSIRLAERESPSGHVHTWEPQETCDSFLENPGPKGLGLCKRPGLTPKGLQSEIS